MRLLFGRVFSCIGVATMACLWPLAAEAQFSHPRPMQRAADEYFSALLKRDFAQLERIADDARRKDTRISDGQPVLAALYEATAGCACGNRFTDELWQLRRTRLTEWKKQIPESQTARVASAAFPVYYAWFARGNNYASSVSAEAWQLFKDRMESGRISLEKLDSAAREDEGWYTAMLWIALAQHWPSDQFDALYERAAKRHPGYLPIHFAASNYYAPEWYGSEKSYSAFIGSAVQRAGPKLGAELYARMNWAHGRDDMFKDGMADWNRMNDGFQQIIRDYPDAWNLNNYARFACMARDWATMNALAAKIGDTPVSMAWYDDKQLYFQCRKFAHAAVSRGISSSR